MTSVLDHSSNIKLCSLWETVRSLAVPGGIVMEVMGVMIEILPLSRFASLAAILSDYRTQRAIVLIAAS